MDDKKYSAEYAASLVLRKAYDVLKKAEKDPVSVEETIVEKSDKNDEKLSKSEDSKLKSFIEKVAKKKEESND